VVAKTEQEVQETNEKAQGSRRKKLLLILIPVLLLLAAVACGFLFRKPLMALYQEYFGQAISENEAAYVVPLREFTVNLADAGGRRYLQTTICLAFDDKKLNKEITRRETEIRSTIIALLRSKKVAQLQEPGGMEALAEEMKAALNKLLNGGAIRDIYFDTFLIQ